MRRLLAVAALAATLMVGSPALAVTLPGLQYEVLRSGPADGPHPTRSDTVTMRYTGRLTDGSVFSMSPDNGRTAYPFDVKGVIPGMSAALQLMRPGDVWRLTLPAYLAYGALGRQYTAPQPLLQRDIPPNSILIFDVELISIGAPATKKH
jgi:FKBP-type peptidyl-prolyl cis-trans isomerase